MQQLKAGINALVPGLCAALLCAGPAAALLAAGGSPAAAQETAKTAKAAGRTESLPGIRLHIQPYEENLTAAPGYAAKLDFITADSAVYPHAAEIGRFVSAQALDALFAARAESATEQAPDFCAAMARGSGVPCANELYMQEEESAQKGDMLSVRYLYSYFPVGAAHPIYEIITYNFILRPLFRVSSLEDLFADSFAAFPAVQKQLRQSLLARKGEDGKPLPDKQTVEQGTREWAMLASFAAEKDGIAVYFSPYAVGSYADGAQKAVLPYAMLKPLLKPFYARALGLVR